MYRIPITLIIILTFTFNLKAQNTGSVTGKVLDAENNQPLAGATVIIPNTNYGTSTGPDGTFTLGNLPAGIHTLKVSFVGFQTKQKRITIKDNRQITVNVELVNSAYNLSGIEVSALRPDLQPESDLQSDEVREANPKDSGELLRSIPGVEAVRRGPIGLDPIVRGLRETQVGNYLDGSRMFPAGPARMDSPLSHLDPSAIQSIQVVKGPYALTWGAGNLSAIRVQTANVKNLGNSTLNGRIGFGYDTNLDALETTATISGREGPVSVWVNGAWREGNDYENGDGVDIPAEYLSREVRGKINYKTGSNSDITLGLGYQNQENIDYPGRLLDADFFDSFNSSLSWNTRFESGSLRELDVQVYYNSVDHGMDNDDKPTAQPVPVRTPPFALNVTVDSEMDVAGGKASLTLVPADFWNITVGGDFYSVNKDAVRTVDRRDNGMNIFVDQMWPDATITDVGFYTRAEHSFSSLLSASGTIRLDLVSADADRASDFFLNNVSGDLDETEANLNGALTVSATPTQNWVFTLGLGSAVRTADATERYSDRIPASKAQTSAEFVGNPALDPERSTQIDLWVEGSYPRFALSANVFTRYIDDYITLRPTGLPKRLPLSPNTVFQYQNGEATFWGFESSAAYRFIPQLQGEIGLKYLWGKDDTVDEPALGVAPFGIDTGLRYENTSGKYFAETTLHLVSEQGRVAATRGEQPTDGYATLDLKTGIQIWNGVSLRAGVNNIFDKQYVDHLNANNPFAGIPIASFTGQRIPEPGRVFFFDISYRF